MIHDKDIQEIERNRQTHYLKYSVTSSLFIFLSLTVYFMAHFTSALAPAIAVNVLYICLGTYIWFLLRAARIVAARNLYIAGLVSSIVLLSLIQYGHKPGFHYYFLILPILALPLWPLRKNIFLPSFFVLNLGLFLVVESLKNQTCTLVSFPDDLVSPMRISSCIISLSSVYFVLIFFINSKELQEQELREKHSLLKNLNVELHSNQHNIDEQKKKVEDLNEELEQQNEILTQKTDELLKANKTKDLLFSIIAHDLKNPLNTMVGLSELMNARIGQYDNDKLKKMSAMILQASMNMKNLTTNLLDWSKTQLYSIKKNTIDFDLKQLIGSNLALIQESSSAKQIHLEVLCPIDTTIYADKDMLDTVLRNLLNNAVKFTPEKGSITIACHLTEHNELCLSIKDSGIGMNPEKIAQLFRVDAIESTLGTANETGSGLGLLVVNEFLAANNCRIQIESTPGSGSTFFVYIPRSNQQHG